MTLTKQEDITSVDLDNNNQPQESTQKKIEKWLYIVIIAGLIFRFIYPFFSHPLDHLYSDADRHYSNIRDDSFASGIYSILDAPLPQFWLKAVFFLFGNTAIGTSFYLGLMCAFAPWPWYRWGREFLPSKNVALVLFAAITWLPSWIGIYSFFMDEALSIIGLGASLWFSWRAKRKQTFGSLILATVIWSITICIKQIVIFELLIVMPWLVMTFLRHRQRRSYLAILLSGLIIVCSYLTYPLWVYRGLGCTWLFSPSMGCMTRAYFLSGAIGHACTFMTNNTLIWQTGYFGSNAMCTESLSPLWHWRTWRKGRFDLVIDLDRKLYLAPPVPHPALKKRLLFMAESALYFFFSRSWPDDRSDDFIQELQIQLRWLWAELPLLIIIFACLKRRLTDMPVVLCLLAAVLYIVCDCSTLEGRYRKPWEGTAIAAYIYILAMPKRIKSQAFEVSPIA